MQLPIAIHKDDGSVYGVTVPDVPGCYSCGDTVEEAISNAKEAIYAHIETLLELGDKPEVKCSSLETLLKDPEFSGAIWGVVDVDLSLLDPKPERVNISLPRFVLAKIDAYTKAKHETRSGFLARAALNELAHQA
ncbi:type II toxin-antitoxin system HicB family antitoxin [Propionivibrio limicola]|uniref:type II toxin-antitoxin system HicB family antitoxin n=1 Tax=Propionivibrio limicola TaxID=167645 RepID=UPI001291B2B0|nr:type II toxin-antitoxin system HicB family antitoxin [Propionivibrio limicola]